MSVSTRKFEAVPLKFETGHRRIHRITCATCGVNDDIPASTANGNFHPNFLTKNWQRKGWQIGRNETRDTCPACVAAARLKKKNTAAEKPETENAGSKALTTVADRKAAEAPRQPGFVEKRIIFSKLEEVYLDEKVGYSGDWTDQKLATSLGVPRKWIEDIREANFGPAANNEEQRKLIDEATKIRAELEVFAAKCRDEVKGFNERLAIIEKKLTKV